MTFIGDFMGALDDLFSVNSGGDLFGKDTVAIDFALSKVGASEIPTEQRQNVMDYIGAQLLHNKDYVPSDIRERLESLLATLRRA
jgi:hypothetical protein